MFQKKTVDEVMSVFNKTIQDLEYVADLNVNALVAKEQHIKKLTEDCEKHNLEKNRALNIRNKLIGLLGGE